tara:strand:+ start:228 stop:836 length:609 start_codon:yes stop_codon:yes gene_type:complete
MKTKYISTYIAFIGVIAAILTIIWSSYELKTDLKFTTALLALAATIFGAILSVFYKRVTTRKYRNKIFISHSFQDNEIADQIRTELRDERFILNIDEKNILVGENIKDTINKELDSSSIIIVLISEKSANSDFVEYEIKNAIEKGKKIFPVLIDRDAKIPEMIEHIKYADLTGDRKFGINQLVKSLKFNLGKEKPAHNNVYN